ncbi:MAG TPA: hypothetical protein VEU07_00290 [Candidatus Acidoferrum sp.]|nr:hypothetical protein [Candidatus Acidoferrum sp.]
MPIQYTQKSFTVLGENSPQAKKNFAEGYARIDWSNYPKPGSQKAAFKPEHN